MTLTEGLIAWSVCSVIVLLALGFEVTVLSHVSALPSKFSRGWRITLVCLGPFTVAVGLLMLFPPTRYLLYMAYAVLIKK
jgi:hypothetical protein